MSDLDRLQADLARAAGALPGKIRGTVFKGAMEIKTKAASLAPDFLGNPRITFEIVTDGDSIAAEIETEGKGGAIGEFGSPTFPGGRPFMLPAARTQADPTEQAVDQIIEDFLW